MRGVKLSRSGFSATKQALHCDTSIYRMAQPAKALVASAVGGSLELRDVLLDNIRPDEALVEIHAVGICHADISCLNGKLPVKFPIVFGHEGSYSDPV